MNKHLQDLFQIIQQNGSLTADQKEAALKSLKDADKELEITAFKLDRTEKVKHTTAILLEETIAELEQKRKSVEAQKRDLEIESSLERVRTVAMGMHKPDDLLSVCEIVFTELQKLGFGELRNAMINIFDDEKTSFLNYDYSDGAGKTITHHFYDSHPVIKKQVEQVRSSSEAFSETVFTGKDLKDWKKFRKEKGEPDDLKVDNVKALYYYFYSIGAGAIGISTYSSISEEKRSLLKRFRNVFDFAYRRYSDVTQAEAQAREAQIELALERVRARTMAMQKSEELSETAHVLYQQFKELGEDPIQITIGIMHEAEGVIEFRVTDWGGGGSQVNSAFNLSIEEPTLLKKVFGAWKEQKKSEVFDLTGKELQGWLDYRNSKTGITVHSADTSGRRVISVAYFSKGHISISSAVPRPKETIQLLERFAGVFDLTYTRFLDLKKAEAQSREVQIELALERVRSRTMAMQKSDELSEVSQVINEQLQQLNFKNYIAGFLMDYQVSDDFEVWRSDPSQLLLNKIRIPYFDHPLFNQQKEAKAKGLDFIAIRLTFDEKNRWVDQALQYSPATSREMKDFVYSGAGYASSCALMKNVGLFIENYEGIPFSESENSILIRFGKVFEQTYTRFLDLQKAEAQAREAKIENALEKVRSRTMAMQQSDELAEASYLLERQVAALGIKTWGCAFHIFRENDSLEWFSNADGVMPRFVIPRTYVWQRYYEACQRGETLHIEEHAGEACTALYEYMAAMPIVGEALQKMKAADIPFPTYQVDHAASFKYGYLLFITFEQVPEAHDIFKRFAKVFEQTYTRFLDLQKAEAQARQAQIELGLERLRARAMAMKKSDELAEVISDVFNELTKLDFSLTRTMLWLFDEESYSCEVWMANSETDKAPGSLRFTIEHPFHERIFNAWKERKTKWVYELKGEEKKQLDDYLFTKTIAANLPEVVKAGIRAPERIINSFSFHNFGGLLADGLEELTEENLEILYRFSKEFDITYTRFLDLLKAEAQARESQIQLALERVRARTMAMQKSEELQDAATVLFKQLRELGVKNLWSAGFVLLDAKSEVGEFRMSNPEGEIQPPVSIPNTEDPATKNMYDYWRNGADYYVEEAGGNDLKKHYDYLLSLPEAKPAFQAVLDAGIALPTWQQWHAVYFSGGYLLVITLEPFENISMLKRFAKVFEQTYTRFLDLQKAEAQARESQIQLAMERVRARTMAMQRSDELAEVATILFQQVKALGVPQWLCGFSIWEIGDKEFTWYPGSPDGDILPPCKIPLTEHPVFISFDESRRRGDELFVYEKEGEFQAEHYRYMLSLPGLRELLQNMLDAGLKFPTFQIDHLANFEHGNLAFITYEHFPEMHDIFKRFAKVFEQTYTRFLDLQKAEAQAQEAQIEAALERVRSRTMAMQHSSELSETSALLFQQIKSLGVPPWSCGFNIWEPGDKVFTSYMGSPDGTILEGGKIPLTEEATFIHFQESRERGDKLFVDVLEGETIENHYRYFQTLPGVKEIFEKRAQAGFPLPTFQINHLANFSHGNLLFITYEPCPEAHDIFIRFAAVFEQTYIRFLDLKKAEAQAREAKIEAALEKVRSRTMAMQRSEELMDAASLLFQQVSALGVTLWGCGFNIWEKDEKICTSYNANPHGTILSVWEIPLTEDPCFIHFYESRQRGDILYVDEMGGEQLEATYHYMRKLPGIGEGIESILKAGNTLPTFQVNHLANFSFGNLLFITYQHVPEAHDIFKRFAKVFEQTYTRFLDLQKAEAQAREAKIEAALERVRSRTMGMQHSNELQETALLLLQQVLSLGVPQLGCGFNIWDDDRKAFTSWMGGGLGENTPVPTFKVPSSEDIFMHIREAAERGDSLFVKEQAGEELETHYRYMFSLPLWKDFMAGFTPPTFQVIHCAFFSQGFLMFVSLESIPEAHDIFKRFAKVFEQTYTRFLDLQKAEAQAREAQIEAALERVRSRSMGMQKSEELKEVIQVVYEQFIHLNIKIEHTGFVIDYKARDDYDIWIADPLGVPSQVIVPYFDSVYYNRFNEAKEKGEDFFATNLSFDEKNKFYQKLFEYVPGLTKEAKEFYFSCPGLAASTVLLENISLYIENFLGIPYTDEENATLMRFGKVFQQAYTRFLDLQKAEAQAREAQIEAALERVRSRTMAMQKGEELAETAILLFEQLSGLGINQRSCGFLIMDEKSETMADWSANLNADGKATIVTGTLSFNQHPIIAGVVQTWKKGKPYFIGEVHGDELQKYYDDVTSKESTSDEIKQKVLALATSEFTNSFYFQFGMMYVLTPESLTEHHINIMLRFAGVFKLTYTRFLDLKQAEAQVREANIEAALERTRTQSMIMQHSKELDDTLRVFHQQVLLLGIQSAFSFLWLPDEEKDQHKFWAAWAEKNSTDFNSKAINYPMNRDEPATAQCLLDWKSNEPVYSYQVPPAGVENYFAVWSELIAGVEQLKPEYFSGGLYYVEAFMKYGCFGVMATTDLTEDEKKLLSRFANEFERTYTRFLDLQKAEAQARESQIEAALERVRSRSMGMQKSEELADVIQVIFEQLVQLNFKIDTAGFAVDYRESDDWYLWQASPYVSTPLKIHIPYFDHPQFNRYIEAKQKGLVLYINRLTFEEKNILIDHVLKYIPEVPPEAKVALYSCAGYAMSSVFLKYVNLYIVNFADIPFSEAENAILIRFGKVFEQTYTRFNDLKQAEAQALEVVKRASVDRVRAEIASMRTTSDLERITPLIWSELTTLGVPFIRCGVFIMDEEQQQVQTHLSTPDGKAIAAFRLNYNGTNQSTQIVGHWRQKKIFKDHMDEAAFTEYTKNLVEQGAVSSGEKYITENLPTNLHLHFLPFLQGMLYVGNTAPLSDDELLLAQNLADAFSTAYARYEDFNKLESANVKIEKTLVDLKQTQAQLVQSEKMASLGELTAGIAHEIQNPLNFVNNFSEVNSELLDELVLEVNKGNLDEIKAIAKNLKENEQKIVHHGKRADAIVKGMLQHSRSSSGVKEPTDINALADEYLRLAYHGLRAKDKSFNATMKTDFDREVGMVNVISQDIGRVVLNLITNAFYAVTEKKRLQPGAYEPTVVVSTKKIDNKILISVKDNGNGIPKKVLDKIFQPFFTTKPTGQGTGLGLSLSYDIVKAHKGELKVETLPTGQAGKESEGAEFTIELPIV